MNELDMSTGSLYPVSVSKFFKGYWGDYGTPALCPENLALGPAQKNSSEMMDEKNGNEFAQNDWTHCSPRPPDWDPSGSDLHESITQS